MMKMRTEYYRWAAAADDDVAVDDDVIAFPIVYVGRTNGETVGSATEISSGHDGLTRLSCLPDDAREYYVRHLYPWTEE